MKKYSFKAALLAATCFTGSMAHAQSSANQQLALNIEEIVVTARPTTYNNSLVSEQMISQQTPLTSALAVIDNLPGVSIQEGDTFGFDDWSTTIAIRGFQVSLDDQQVGITIDGLPNGNSNYGGGAKANRYIDSQNMGGVEVSQGTTDISSRSTEALGGTLNFLTQDPLEEQRIRFSASIGQFESQRYYARYDTGELFNSNTFAWISLSHQEATDWVNGAAENRRDHLAAKLRSEFGDATDLTIYFSYDDAHEDNYQRLFSAADFASNPNWDQLTDEWTGLPYVDQLYRKGWSTLRENLFTYVKLDTEISDNLTVNGAVYTHHNYGRGDWVPPYLVNVRDDGAGNGHSEFLGGSPVEGGSSLGLIQFVDASGVQLSPTAGCESSITFPYGGAGPEFDPACHVAGAIPVQSYRHTHYRKQRYGVTADFQYDTAFGDFDNMLSGGLWYEDTTREEWRDWHKITDTRVGFEFDNPAYWVQYSRKYPQTTFKWYLQDQVTFGPVTATFGIKQFLVDVKRNDLFGESPNIDVNSDSKVLFSGGLLYDGPFDGLQLFAGYAQNFAPFKDLLLERPASDFSNLSPETAYNFDIGMRYTSDRFTASLAYYNIEFKNRIIFLDAQDVSGPNFLIGTDGTYFNAGGITSDGVEASLGFRVLDDLALYASYTYNSSEYLGTGDPLVDAEVGITPGNTVVAQPEHMFVISADWARGPYSAGISAKYTDDRFVNFANTWTAKNYVITDINVGVSGDAISDSLRNVSASLVVNNLFDVDYMSGIAGQGAWIGAPRTVVFTLTADF